MRVPRLNLHLAREQLQNIEHVAERGSIAMQKVTRTLVERSGSSSDSSPSSTCASGNDSGVCEKPADAGDSQTLAIALGAVIPLVCAVIVLIFLHRRHLKKQRQEDANDPHKSLDFGVDMPTNPSGKKRSKKHGLPEMTVSDLDDPTRPDRRLRGLSMDMDSSPYLLPAGLQGSRGSIHSMSRTQHDEHDPYRPVTFVRPSMDSYRSPRMPNETGSMYSASTIQTEAHSDNSNLLQNAQRMSQSLPFRGDSRSPQDPKSSPEANVRQLHSTGHGNVPSRKTSLASGEQSSANGQMRNDTFPSPTSVAKSPSQDIPPPRTTSASATRPPRNASLATSSPPVPDIRHMSDSSYYGDDQLPPPPPPPQINEPQKAEYDIDPNMISAGRFSIDTAAPSQQYPVVQSKRVSVMGLRPLPPDNPEENAEQRANRIRSFYKEYFDDSRPNPNHGYYQEDYDPGYLEGAVYDPQTGGYAVASRPVAPFAQPIGRRAMTPPPGGAPRFAGAAAHRRQFSTQSAGRGQLRGRAGGPAPPMPTPKVKRPPPKPLQGLPTPHKLNGDDAIFQSIDFAPPTSFRETQNGRAPDSPTGTNRPFSPSVRAYSPLVQAFDELSVMPSPHMLRKSGTFTSLDFAPPSRFRDSPNGSDAGSIRSARSGISAMQLDAVRAGAYRVSRIPKEMVTTREDMTAQLRPKMDMLSRA